MNSVSSVDWYCHSRQMLLIMRGHISLKDFCRKRKLQDSICESNLHDNSASSENGDMLENQAKKQNHSEIEKRRRDKMNTYITELSSMIPMCKAMSKKMDKLTVLRMAVQHMKSLRGSMSSYSEGLIRPSFLTEEELKFLILQAAEGFLFVVNCDRGRIMFVSESVSEILNYSQRELLGQNWFDLLHPKDIAKVKEQLQLSNLSPKDKLIDSRTKLPVKNEISLIPGSRRSFYCRMKYKPPLPSRDATTLLKKCKSSDRRFCTVYCMGYLKSWATENLSMEGEDNESSNNNCNLGCLVVIGQVQPDVSIPPSQTDVDLRPMQFTSRHSMDGKFLFADHRVTTIVSYLPQELLGTSFCEYVTKQEAAHVFECFKQALKCKKNVVSQMCRFQIKNSHHVCLQSQWKSFHNPWTKEFEFMVAVHSPILYSELEPSRSMTDESNTILNSFDSVLSFTSTSETTSENGQAIKMQGISEKFKENVAEDKSKYQTSTSSSSVSYNSVVTSVSQINNSSAIAFVDSTRHFQHMSGDENVDFKPVASNTAERPFDIDQKNSLEIDLVDSFLEKQLFQASCPTSSNSDGNDEAAMSVIMSLLEADAGLGGPIDFSGLPWPLP